MKTYKRRYRNMPPETRMKISKSLKGRKKSNETRRAISKGLRRYWKKVAWEGDAYGKAD